MSAASKMFILNFYFVVFEKANICKYSSYCLNIVHHLLLKKKHVSFFYYCIASCPLSLESASAIFRCEAPLTSDTDCGLCPFGIMDIFFSDHRPKRSLIVLPEFWIMRETSTKEVPPILSSLTRSSWSFNPTRPHASTGPSRRWEDL